MKLKFTHKVAGIAAIFAFGMAGAASAQDNPLLQPAEANPLLQQNTSTESVFEARSRAIDLAATKDSSDPVCQNIRANYDQQLAEIMAKYETADGASLSQLNQGIVRVKVLFPEQTELIAIWAEVPAAFWVKRPAAHIKVRLRCE